jgi:hypothetical protein
MSPLRAHCDRCDALCDEYPTWVEVDPPMVTPHLMNTIWHLVIHAGGQVPCEEKIFCRACRIAILEAHVAALKLVKAPSGGHLADCKWDLGSRRYVCAEGCEIKRINEAPRA